MLTLVSGRKRSSLNLLASPDSGACPSASRVTRTLGVPSTAQLDDCSVWQKGMLLGPTLIKIRENTWGGTRPQLMACPPPCYRRWPNPLNTNAMNAGLSYLQDVEHFLVGRQRPQVIGHYPFERVGGGPYRIHGR